MNSFIPENPRVVIGPKGHVIVNNIHPALEVIFCPSEVEFEAAKLGMPFDSSRPMQPQVFSTKK